MGTGVDARAGGGCIVHGCQNKKSQIEKVDQWRWMTSCTGSACGGFGRFWKKSVSWEVDSEWEGSTFGVLWGQTILCATGAVRDGEGADGKCIIERLCIYLPYVETFNWKGIKGFVPELRSRYVFFVVWDYYVLCIYVMNILCCCAVTCLTSHKPFQ